MLVLPSTILLYFGYTTRRAAQGAASHQLESGVVLVASHLLGLRRLGEWAGARARLLRLSLDALSGPIEQVDNVRGEAQMDSLALAGGRMYGGPDHAGQLAQ